MTKIYTKTGDKGNTGTFKGRMSKSDQLAEALGTIDELNSWVGECRNNLAMELDIELKRIQTNLMTLASGLAGSGLQIKPYEVKHLEKLIDKLSDGLPKLTNFIYPVGKLQVARAVCRRAERRVVASGGDVVVKKYLNRLSDALFTMARWANWKRGKEEIWKG